MSYTKIKAAQINLETADYDFREACAARMEAEISLVKAIAEIGAFDLLKVNRARVRNLLRHGH